MCLGLRILLEGICNDLGIKKGYIYSKDKQIIKKKMERPIQKKREFRGEVFWSL